ncbi:DUF2461 domain-containing protein [Mycobacterium simiae]|uniref:DUF2461 domain-containing protein n=1 Tax=Mycobacterium simiae TaxID=1784 RepID=A0A5B1BQH3_MYCSI|nr:DUF2461 domain-containing protein [Mycobacterium simiae]KAA1249464.1 DUF2461 domain-containing protein [Mycobacterium simiae]
MGTFRFPAATVNFLTDLRAHNEKSWFDANRGRYQAEYLEPAKEFVEEIGPELVGLVPGIRAEPWVRGSIFRINRDIRFSKDKRPYKDHLDFWFWEGDRAAAVAGLFLRVSPDAVLVGAGAHGFDNDQLSTYRAAVVDPASGPELAAVVSELDANGYEVGGETFKRVPRGFDATAAVERLLRHSALYAHTQLPVRAASSAGFVDTVLADWRTFLGLYNWLTEHV